jgi:endonuclease YncB( thermonuclease family)
VIGMAVGAIAFVVMDNVKVPTGETIAGPASVIDGDGLRVDGEAVRLFGIDAVEYNQTCVRDRDGVEWACGRESTAALRRAVDGQAVNCEIYDTDVDGRPVARCLLPDGADVGAEQVRAGWAVAYTNYSVRYVPDEAQARAEGAGIWNSRFKRPSAWRRETSS